VTIIVVRTAYLLVLRLTLTLVWERDQRIRRPESPEPAINLRTVMQVIEYQNKLNEPTAYVLQYVVELRLDRWLFREVHI
jgi:hypothetical protein